MKNKQITKTKLISNIIFNFIAFVSTTIALISMMSIYKLDILPTKYLIILYSVLVIIYFVLLFLTLKSRTKTSIKFISAIFLVILILFLGYNFKFVYKINSFFDTITSPVLQKEKYYVCVLNDSSKKNLDDLKKDKIGFFINKIDNNLIKEQVEKEVHHELIVYDDALSLFRDLQSAKIDAVIINDLLKNTLDNELASLEMDLVDIGSILVSFENTRKNKEMKFDAFNIYLVGSDIFTSIDNVAQNDINIVLSINSNNDQILLTTIPRDYYINLPDKGEKAYDKLAHIGYNGVETSMLAIEKLLNIEMDYYIKFNWKTIEEIINSLNGIDLYNTKDFCTTKTNICYEKGNIHLDGYNAIMYAQESYLSSDEDIKNNQKIVIKTFMEKITDSKYFFAHYDQFLDALSSTIITNLDANIIRQMLKWQIDKQNTWRVESQSLTGTSSLSKNCYSLPNVNFSVMQKDDESIEKAIQKIHQ